MESVLVEIFGRRIRLRGDDPEKIRNYAGYLNSQLEELQEKLNLADSSKVLLLGAMIITEKLFQSEDRNRHLESELARLDQDVRNFLERHK